MYVLRSDINCVKYAKTRPPSDPYFSVYNSVHMRENTDTILSIYGKIQIRKIRHFCTTVPNETDFTIEKFSFFQRLIVIQLLVSEMI